MPPSPRRPARPAAAEPVSPRDVRRSRQALGLSQEQFARRLGVSFATVNRWERGHSAPRRAALARLSAVCLLTPSRRRPAVPRRELLGVPATPTRFIGRTAELEAIPGRLQASPLVTLVGPGGAGKTRLAIEAVTAAPTSAAIPARVAFASLEGVAADADVAAAVLFQLVAAMADASDGAGSAGAATSSEPIDRLAALLAERRGILVLDGCEHALEGTRTLVRGLLGSCPELAVLATSRAELGIEGEAVVPVGPLPIAETTDADAVALFVDRVRRRAPGWQPAPADVVAIAAVGRRLDGLPLAIELAAGLVPARTPGEVLASLGRRLGSPGTRSADGTRADRGSAHPGSPDAAERAAGERAARERAGDRTLDAALASSYERLGRSARRLFERLSVFPGSFSLDAAEAVAGTEALLDLATLVGASMLEVRAGPVPRYVLLETLRDFGRERLRSRGDADAAMLALTDWSIAFALRASRGMVGRDQAAWLHQAAEESESVAAAIRWAAASGDASRAVQLAGAFWRFWYSRSDLDTGIDLLTAALNARGPVAPAARARALLGAGVLARQRGDLASAARLLREHLAIARDLGDEHAVAEAHNSLAGVLHRLGQPERARRLLLDSLDWWERSRDRRGAAAALSNLGVLAADEGDLEAARTYGEEALSLRLELGHEEGIAISFENLAGVRLAAGATDEARDLYAEALDRYLALDEPDGVAGALEGLARVLPAAEAITLAAVADRVRRTIAVPRSASEEAALATRLAEARAVLGSDSAAAALARADGLDLPAAAALARTHLGSGRPSGDAASWHLRRRLSPREREILALVTEGHTSKEIAARLDRSVRTVERHLGNVYAKIGARGRADAIATGLRMAIAAARTAPDTDEPA